MGTGRPAEKACTVPRRRRAPSRAEGVRRPAEGATHHAAEKKIDIHAGGACRPGSHAVARRGDGWLPGYMISQRRAGDLQRALTEGYGVAKGGHITPIPRIWVRGGGGEAPGESADRPVEHGILEKDVLLFRPDRNGAQEKGT